MAAARFDANIYFARLHRQLLEHIIRHNVLGDFAPECDIVLDDLRLIVADLIWITPEQSRAQRRIAPTRQRRDPRRSPLYVPPTLVIESVSYGHEDHDRITKFNWYAEFGVPHYWIFDSLNRRLDCFVLTNGKYAEAATGRNDDAVRLPLFDGMTLDMAALWRDE